MNPRPVVVDTNVALDLLLFDDPATRPLHEALRAGRLQWLATPVMRDELAHVLAYPHLVRQMGLRQLQPVDVLAAFDRLCHMDPPAARAGVVCTDPDDQVFIDLAVVHRALLLSKDRAVLATRKRLAALGVQVRALLVAEDLSDPDRV